MLFIVGLKKTGLILRRLKQVESEVADCLKEKSEGTICLQRMGTLCYPDIIKSNDQYDRTASNLVQRQRSDVCSNEMNCSVILLAVPGQIKTFLEQNVVESVFSICNQLGIVNEGDMHVQTAAVCMVSETIVEMLKTKWYKNNHKFCNSDIEYEQLHIHVSLMKLFCAVK